jgi:hypothetical protein
VRPVRVRGGELVRKEQPVAVKRGCH